MIELRAEFWNSAIGLEFGSHFIESVLLFSYSVSWLGEELDSDSDRMEVLDVEGMRTVERMVSLLSRRVFRQGYFSSDCFFHC